MLQVVDAPMAVYRFTLNSSSGSGYHRASATNCRLTPLLSLLTPMLNQMRRFLNDRSGAAAILYELLASAIPVAIVPTVKDLGSKLVVALQIAQNAD